MPPRTLRVPSSRRHPDYEYRLATIAKRRSEGASWNTIAAELGLKRNRVQALAQLLPGSEERKTP